MTILDASGKPRAYTMTDKGLKWAWTEDRHEETGSTDLLDAADVDRALAVWDFDADSLALTGLRPRDLDEAETVDACLHALTYSAEHFDHHMAGDVWRRLHEKTCAALPNPGGPIDQATWTVMVTERLADPELDDYWRDHLTALIDDSPGSVGVAHAVLELPGQADRAQRSFKRQVEGAAAMNGVDPELVADRIAEMRTEYAQRFGHLDPSSRPAPPQRWITGFTAVDNMARSCPHDPATLYAIYRAQADRTVFDDVAARRGFVSADLETAGPVGPQGFKAWNGQIIEVGMISYDFDGNETGRFEQLIRPDDAFLTKHGTGAVEVHQISVDDLEGAPDWKAVAPQVVDFLDRGAMVAQNDYFERSWLSHHLKEVGVHWDKDSPGSDTLQIARQHLSDLSNFRLATICEAVGVEYTSGHRALHDSDVTGKAFFEMRRRIWEEFDSSALAEAVHGR